MDSFSSLILRLALTLGCGEEALSSCVPISTYPKGVSQTFLLGGGACRTVTLPVHEGGRPDGGPWAAGFGTTGGKRGSRAAALGSGGGQNGPEPLRNQVRQGGKHSSEGRHRSPVAECSSARPGASTPPPRPVCRGFASSGQRNRCWEAPPGSTFRSCSLRGSCVPPGAAGSLLSQVEEGGRAPLSFPHFFDAADQDGLRSDAVITLSALPRYGCIENAGTGRPWPGGRVAPDLATREGGGAAASSPSWTRGRRRSRSISKTQEGGRFRHSGSPERFLCARRRAVTGHERNRHPYLPVATDPGGRGTDKKPNEGEDRMRCRRPLGAARQDSDVGVGSASNRERKDPWPRSPGSRT